MAIDAIRPHLLISVWLAALSIVSGCRAPDLSDRTEEEPPQPSTEILVAAPRTSSQLLSGWYPIEHNSWRWTAGKFAVLLRPPIGAAVKGATLTLHFTLPGIVISRLGSVTLSASIQGSRLAPQTYRTEGKAMYARDVPPSSLSGNTVRIDFELDKVMAPGEGDTRELGVVADRVGLEAK
ncbi:MAG: hypothetical protein LAP39_15930 [Acidobacteriia bacterium]|nr:hypothetical protein [Terriglobia bacterium]